MRWLKEKRYLPVLLGNFLKRVSHFQKVDNKYVFILGATHSGTTLMNEILSTSQQASSNNIKHTREGQLLPTVREHMFTHKQQWNEQLDWDWDFIKREWRKYWDVTKPILIEKSPPNLLRAFSIERIFVPSYFIVFVRNPYAHCETFIRKNRYSPEEAAHFVTNTLNYQKKNLEQLQNTVLITYELLVESPEEFKNTIHRFLPELNDIRTEGFFSAHNFYNKPQEITNFNKEKIERLSKGQLLEINRVFERESKLLQYFGYSIIDV